MYFLYLLFFIVVQLQLSAFSPHPSTPPSPFKCLTLWYIICILCVHYPKSNHLLLPYIWTLLPFTTFHPPLPSGNHLTVTCVHDFFYYCSFVAFSFITCMSEIIWFLTFSFWLILLSMIFSWSIHVVTNGRSFHCLHSFALARMSYTGNHTVFSLSKIGFCLLAICI